MKLNKITLALLGLGFAQFAIADNGDNSAMQPETAAQSEAGAAQTQTLQNIIVSGVNRSTRTENKDTYTTSAMKTTTGLALSPKETPQSVSVITKT